MRRLLALLWLAGCAAGPTAIVQPPCVSDAECGPGLACFAEGCGDPGKGLVVEITGSAGSTQFVKDVAITDGTLAPTFDFALGDPLQIIGEFQQELTAKVDPANRAAYLKDVRLQAFGASELIPGISRTFEQRVVAPVRGTFQMSVGAGLFTLTATPDDTSVPPLSATKVAVRSGAAAPAVDFAFPSIDGTVTLSGRLLKSIDASRVPTVELALTSSGTAMDLQAFDPETNLPLSQRFPVSSGQAGATGNFTITMSPTANTLKAISLVATPREAGAPLPSKTFTVVAPIPNTVTLELGDPGSLVSVKGVAKDSAGAPIASAQVFISGTVNGGGTFRSKIATSDGNGAFALDSLGGAMQLTILPPSDSIASATTTALTIPSTSATPVAITCPDRVLLTGRVVQPDGTTPAVAVGVRAIEHAGAPGFAQSLMLDTVSGLTDGTGTFSLRLDAAEWRLEFSSRDRFPLASRLVTVQQTVDALGHPILTQTLPSDLTLASGRTVKGTVTGSVASKPGTPLGYSTLRFFRVAPVGGVTVSTLVGSTVADEKGTYSIVLPASKQ